MPSGTVGADPSAPTVAAAAPSAKEPRELTPQQLQRQQQQALQQAALAAEQAAFLQQVQQRQIVQHQRMAQVPLEQQMTLQRDTIAMQPRQHFRQNSARFAQRPVRTETIAALTEAATATFEALQPPEDDRATRQGLHERLQALVATVAPNASLLPFGSSVSGLASRGADLDLTLMPPGSQPRALPLEQQAELVELIAKVMEDSGQMSEVHARPKARVPIVALKDASTGLKCDICMCNQLALINSRLMRAYMLLDPRARALAFIIKHWAKRRQINDPYHGSPSSYAWVLLVIHFLQTTSPPVLPVLQDLHGPKVAYSDAGLVRTPDGREFDCYFYDDVEGVRAAHSVLPTNSESLGSLLVGFFRRYAREFDFVKSVTSIRTGLFLTKRDKNWDKKEAGFRGDRHLFCMEDPFELTHDLGRVMDRDTLRDVRAEIDRADHLLSEQRGTFEALTQPFSVQQSGGKKAAPAHAKPAH
mmetsp:Transcript_25725/g.65397  ORF Transcript_25725/g.65397 Transcript_25725/m.65397 type:complete len:474 (-) Transcript_25725:539-1960(-)